MLESNWLLELLQRHLPGLISYLDERFPAGPTFHTGHLNYARIASNLEYLEVILIKLKKKILDIYPSFELLLFLEN